MKTRTTYRRFWWIPALLILTLFAGCSSLSGAVNIAGSLMGARGDIDAGDAVEMAGAAGDVISAINETFTPEQQYYVGRSVAAVILDQYETYEDDTATGYLNALGQALALASPVPYLFNDYRFLILEGDDINAFATPGGHIFVTRGMIRLARSEDDLAAVLAHEIGHIVLQHGMKTIKSARISSATVGLLQTSADALTDGQIEELTQAFAGSIDDMAQTLVTNGYSRATEREADAAAVALLAEVGYDPAGLIRILERMEAELDPDGLDFAKTHPKPADRITWIQEIIDEGELIGRSNQAVTQARFDQAVGDL